MTYYIANRFLEALHETGVLPEWESVTRVVIDFKVGEVARFYVERLADDRMLNVVLAGGLEVTTNADDATITGRP